MTIAKLILHFASEQDFKDRRIQSARVEIETGECVGRGPNGYFRCERSQEIELNPSSDADVIGDSRWDLRLSAGEDPQIVLDTGTWFEEYDLAYGDDVDEEDDGSNLAWLRDELARPGRVPQQTDQQ